MGDHPIVRTGCGGKGCMFCSAIGYRAKMYADFTYQRMVTNAIVWASSRNNPILRSIQ